MPCLCRMNKNLLKGLIWLYIFSTGLFVVSLEPGYLDFDNLPDTNFSCVGKVIGGYYADLEANCQMFHVCTIGQLDEPMDIRFLCLNGTVFDQETRVCERIDEVDCSKSEKFYSLNLELYGNTQPPILEENAETEAPIFEKSTPSTTTTTSTTERPTTTTTRSPHYFTSSIRPVTSTAYHKRPGSHQFSIGQHAPEYTPEEINISLNPGAPPNIRTKPFEFPRRPYSDNVNSNNKKIIVTTHSSVIKNDNDDENKQSVENGLHISSSTTESDKINYNIQTPRPTHNNFNFRYSYQDVNSHDFNFPRPHNYHYQSNIANLRPPGISGHSYTDNPYRSSTHRNEYLPVARKSFEVTSTARSFFLQPIKSPSHQYFTRTEKPQGEQLPVPVLPTLGFSSPAPFTLSRHIETKRYTDEHELPPRIIISASASVSDANGRTLNYSLGTIGAAQILAQPPSSYDDYKEDDVVLDPFFHDVPKVQNKERRTKRDIGQDPDQSNTKVEAEINSKLARSKRTPQSLNPSDIIKSEDEAIEVLKFLFDWYKTHEKTTKSTTIGIPVSPEEITNINEAFSQRTYVSEDYPDDQPQNLEKSNNPDTSGLFNNRNKFNTDGKLSENHSSRGHENSLHRVATEPYRSSTDRNLFHDIIKPPKTEIINHSYESNSQVRDPVSRYNIRASPKYKETADHHNRETLETYDSRIRSPTTNRQKPYRGRHRFTHPFSTTEKHRSQQGYEEAYELQTEPYISKQKGFKDRVASTIGGLERVSEVAQYDSVQSNNGLHREQGEKSAIIRNQGVDNYSYNHRISNLPSPFTEKLPSRRFEGISNQQTQEILRDQNVIHDRITQDINNTAEQFGVTVANTEPNSTEISETYPQQTESATKALKKIENTISEKVKIEAPVLNNNSSILYQATPTLEKNDEEKHSDLKSTIFNSSSFDYSYDELNRQESQKTTKQINKNDSTEHYGSFDTYDYVNDNYEPITYTENPAISSEHQLEKAEENIRGIIHEETNINIDFTEEPHKTSLVTDSESDTVTESKSDTVTENYGSTEGNFGINISDRLPEKINDTNSVVETSPKYKYIDKNLNSFGDILKSLRDFQTYEQNIYNYQHNLTGIKEYYPDKMGKNNADPKAEDEDEEIQSAVPPLSWESNTGKILDVLKKSGDDTTLRNKEETNAYVGFTTEEYRNQDNLNTNREVAITTTGSFENNISTTVPPEEEQLYTSKPLNDIKSKISTTNLDYMDETISPKYVPFGTEYTETTSTSVVRTTTVNPVKEITTNHAGSTSLKDEQVEINMATATILTDEIIPKTRSRLRGRNQQKYRESSRQKIEIQPETAYTSKYYREPLGNRRNNRRRQQNKISELEKLTIASQIRTSTPLPDQTDSTPDWSKLDSVQVATPDNLLGGYIPQKSNTELYINNIVANVTVNLGTIQKPTETSTSALASSGVENTTGFFITKQPSDHINQGHSLFTTIEKEQTVLPISLGQTENYLDSTNRKIIDENIPTDETAKTSEDNVLTTSDVPPTFVFIIKTTENTQTDTTEPQDHASTIETTTVPPFESLEKILSETEFRTIGTTSATASDISTRVNNNDATTPTMKETADNSFTLLDTTTNYAGSTKSEATTLTPFESLDKLFSETEFTTIGTTSATASDISTQVNNNDATTPTVKDPADKSFTLLETTTNVAGSTKTETPFETLGKLFSGTEFATSETTSGTASEVSTQLNNNDATTPTVKETEDKFSTLLETTTNIAGSTKPLDDQANDLVSTIIDSSTSSFDLRFNLIREIETTTSSSVVSESTQDITPTEERTITSTQQSKMERLDKIEHTSNSIASTQFVQRVTDDVPTSTEESTVIIKLTDPTTEQEIESRTVIPSTKIEINTEISVNEDVNPKGIQVTEEYKHETSFTTKEKANSQNSFENEVSNERTQENGGREGGYYSRRRTQQKLPKRTKSPNFRRFSSKHRFSTGSVTPRIGASRKSFGENRSTQRHSISTTPKSVTTSEPNGGIDIHSDSLNKASIPDDDIAPTVTSLPKNLKPTQGDSKGKIDLNTTPLSMLYRVQLRKEKVNKQFIFNCFGKPLNTFYSDPRDCRLFHYCTNGYTKNQLLDMKFVCDLGTHFDEEKLVCTQEVPKRCL